MCGCLADGRNYMAWLPRAGRRQNPAPACTGHRRHFYTERQESTASEAPAKRQTRPIRGVEQIGTRVHGEEENSPGIQVRRSSGAREQIRPRRAAECTALFRPTPCTLGLAAAQRRRSKSASKLLGFWRRALVPFDQDSRSTRQFGAQTKVIAKSQSVYSRNLRAYLRSEPGLPILAATTGRWETLQCVPRDGRSWWKKAQPPTVLRSKFITSPLSHIARRPSRF